MSLDHSWQDDWAETWLSRPAYIGMLDHWVRRRHVQHHEAAERQALYGTVGPWTIAGLVSDVHRHAMASHWL